MVNTFVTVAAACGLPEHGTALTRPFWARLEQIVRPTALVERRNNKRLTVMFLKWLDPPFNTRHWFPDMLTHVGCAPLGLSPPNTRQI